ncbi:MAG: SDR family oxidoreductase [Rhodospirillaceae bacterium]|jgi:2-hydroxycyclohexanecarboxyl-CoA dehydrogenase|nr:SDR family oxidoreductase [Rhodospirillaceae bacterium]MBT5812665.1 SDR family oxidoreductase [Rhodospirillaceae bacterium]
MDFTGKQIIVTGGASGIGRATVLAFCKAGGSVFFGDLNADGAAETVAAASDLKGDAAFHALDVTDEAAIDAFAAAFHETHEQADIVVNVAGWDISQPFMDNTSEFIQKVVAINYLGPVYLTRAFLPKMIEGNGGKVVNTASDAGRVGSMGETVYSGAKGGVIAFTKSLAREMARYRINVNCVAPGPTDTPLFGEVPEKLQQALIRAIPMRRLATPEDIAGTILFFASPTADYITGQVLSVSGGLTMSD